MGGRFEPYLDPSVWPDYNGPLLYPDSRMKVEKKGRRQTKRFKGDMDDWGGGQFAQWGNQHFQEPRTSENPITGGSSSRVNKRKRLKGNDDAGANSRSRQRGRGGNGDGGGDGDGARGGRGNGRGHRDRDVGGNAGAIGGHEGPIGRGHGCGHGARGGGNV